MFITVDVLRLNTRQYAAAKEEHVLSIYIFIICTYQLYAPPAPPQAKVEGTRGFAMHAVYWPHPSGKLTMCNPQLTPIMLGGVGWGLCTYSCQIHFWSYKGGLRAPSFRHFKLSGAGSGGLNPSVGQQLSSRSPSQNAHVAASATLTLTLHYVHVTIAPPLGPYFPVPSPTFARGGAGGAYNW